MAVDRNKRSLQHRVYHGTRRAVRRWRAEPLKTRVPKRLKIFTNVQSASVAGITRVMSSFAEHVNASSDTMVELVCVSVAPNDLQHPGGGWQKEVDDHKHLTSLLYEGEVPPFGDVLESARTVDEVAAAYRSLTDAYREKLKEEKPDVVLVNGTYVVAWCLMAAARSLRLPVVQYYHGSLTKETEHWKEEKKKRLIHQLELSFDRADLRYVFPSTLVKHYVERSIFGHSVRRGQGLVLPNPIPDEFFEAPLQPHKSGIAFVGRWTRIKNTAFVNKFVTINAYEKEPLQVLVVTDQAGRAKASKVLHDRAEFAGPFANPKDLARFYAERKAVLCPSHFETYGNVAQEAVASGTPALVSRNMGVAEVFRSIGLGELVVSFAEPRKTFDLLHAGALPVITNSAREALRALAGEEVVHKKLLEFITS